MSEENGCLNLTCEREFNSWYESFISLEIGNQESTYEKMSFCSIGCLKEYFADKDTILVKLVKDITENRKLAISEMIADNPNYAKEIQEVMI